MSPHMPLSPHKEPWSWGTPECPSTHKVAMQAWRFAGRPWQTLPGPGVAVEPGQGLPASGHSESWLATAAPEARFAGL